MFLCLYFAVTVGKWVVYMRFHVSEIKFAANMYCMETEVATRGSCASCVGLQNILGHTVIETVSFLT